MLELVEMEMRELLSHYGFEGDETPIIFGSALCALEGKRNEIGTEKIDELLKQVDEWIQPHSVTSTSRSSCLSKKSSPSQVVVPSPLAVSSEVL